MVSPPVQGPQLYASIDARAKPRGAGSAAPPWAPRALSTAIVYRALFYSARKKKASAQHLSTPHLTARRPCHARAGEGFGNGATAKGLEGYSAPENPHGMRGVRKGIRALALPRPHMAFEHWRFTFQPRVAKN